MKKIILSMAVAAVLFSCEEDKLKYDGPDFVSLNDSSTESYSIKESGCPLEFTISTSKVFSQNITINIDVQNGTAVKGVHFDMPSSVELPAGAQSVNFQVTPIDNTEENENREFKFVLSSTSNGAAIGLSGDVATREKTIVLVNDDYVCDTLFSAWLGAILVDDYSDAGALQGTHSGKTGTTIPFECDALLVDDDLSEMLGYHAAAGVATKEPNTKFNIKFTSTSADGSIGTVSVPETYTIQYNHSSGLLDCKYGGTGTYNADTGEISITYQVNAYNAAGTLLGYLAKGVTVIRIPACD